MPRSHAPSAAVLAALTLAGVPSARAADLYPALGPVVGGGSLIGLDVTVPLGSDVTLAVDAGLRPGISVERAYANFDLGIVVAAELSKGKASRHGIFGTAGASAPAEFFDAWTAVGWHFVSYDRRELRQFTLDLGPAVYLIREMPRETALTVPAFVYVRFVFHIPLAPAPTPRPPTLVHGSTAGT